MSDWYLYQDVYRFTNDCMVMIRSNIHTLNVNEASTFVPSMQAMAFYYTIELLLRLLRNL